MGEQEFQRKCVKRRNQKFIQNLWRWFSKLWFQVCIQIFETCLMVDVFQTMVSGHVFLPRGSQVLPPPPGAIIRLWMKHFKIDVHAFVRPPYLIKDWLIRPHAEIFLMDHVYFLIMVFNLNCMISMNRAKLKDLAKIYGICFFLFLGGNTLYKLTSMDVRNVGPVFPGTHYSL